MKFNVVGFIFIFGVLSLPAENIIINQVSNSKTVKDSSSYVNTGIDLGQNPAENTVSGNGKMETKVIELPDFKSIEIDIPLNIHIICGKTAQMTITAESNIIPLINYSAQNSVLKLSIDKSISANAEIKIQINSGDIKEIIAKSGASISMTGVNNNYLMVRNTGASEINISGRTRKLQVVFDGTGSLNARELKSEDADINFSGAGAAEIYASRELTAKITGAAEVTYYGNPELVRNDSQVKEMLVNGGN